MKQVLLLIAFIFSAVSITAQNDERQFIDIVKKDNMYVVMVNDGVYIFRFYSSEIVETIFRPSWDKNPYDTISYAVFSKPKFSNYEVTERAEDILIKTKDIYINHQKPIPNFILLQGQTHNIRKKRLFQKSTCTNGHGKRQYCS